ncbi:unnamed protein product [Calypogeia fissa]
MGFEDEGGVKRLQQQLRVAQWRANMAAMKEKVRERFRVTSVPQGFLRQSQRLQPGGGVGLRGATATGLAVARVFQGNIVLARMARSMARNEWQKRMGKFGEFLPRFRTLAASVTAGSAAAFSDPAQAEALEYPSASYSLGHSDYDDHEVSITLRRQRSGQAAMILAADPTSTETEEFRLFRDDSAFLKTMQAVAVPLIGNACHIFMHGLNSTEVYGAEKMQAAVFNRRPGQPLITVSNHTAAVDDPFVISSVLPAHQLLNASNLRWTLCATEKCFSSPAMSAFFRSVKVLPLTKGHGVFQEGMEVALTKLNRGEWVHIFPEGSRSRDANLQFFKRGVGRLVLDADNLPLVIPFIHKGMNDVMPIGQKMFSTGKKVTILVGDPIYVEDLVKKHVEEGLSKAVLYDAITLRIESTIWKMQKELDELVEQSNRLASEKACKRVEMTHKVQGIWQYADWEAQGYFLDDASTGAESVIASNAMSGDGKLTPSGSSTCAAEELGAGRLDGQPYPGDGELRLTDIYSGTLNRIQSRIDPSMFMGFAARGLLASRAKLDDRLESLSRRYWRQMSALENNSWHTC